MSIKKVILQICWAKFKEIIALVEKILSLEENRLDELENELIRIMKEMMSEIAQAVLNEYANREQKRPEQCKCGRRAHLEKSVWVSISTLLGELRIRKRYFRCPDKKKCKNRFAPEEKRYGLYYSRYSKSVYEEIVRSGLEGSLRRAESELKRRGVANVSHETIRRMMMDAGRRSMCQSQRYYEEIESRCKPVIEEAQMCYSMIDGTQVNTLSGWREVKLCVLTDSEKEVKVYTGYLGNWKEFCEPLRTTAAVMGVKQSSQVISIGDGAGWVKRVQESCFPTGEFILDFYHVLEHIADCSRQVYGEGTEKGVEWYERCKDMLYEYGGERLYKYLRRWRGSLKKRKRKYADALLSYIEPRLMYMNYPEYRSRGLQIGSGEVESACKNVVGCRLKGGRRWRVENAEVMLWLLCAYHTFGEIKFLLEGN